MEGCQKEEKIIFTFLIDVADTSNKRDCPSPPVLGSRPYNSSLHLPPSHSSQGHPKDTKVIFGHKETKMLAMILSLSMAALVAGSALPHPEMPPLQERGGLHSTLLKDKMH